MSSLESQIKFLLDENVNRGLKKFLEERGFNVIISPKGIKDDQLAAISKREERILVTNDHDFAYINPENAFSIVLCELPQGDINSSFQAFSLLLKEKNQPMHFEGKMFLLRIGSFKILNDL